MTRATSLFGAVALTFAVSGLAGAQADPAEQPQAQAQEQPVQTRAITGEVIEVSPAELAIATETGERMTFGTVDLATSDDTVSVGDTVRVEYRLDMDNDEMEAISVQVVEQREDPAVRADNGAGVRERMPAEEAARPSQPEQARARGELPATAGPLPALIALGLAFLGGGIGIASTRRS